MDALQVVMATDAAHPERGNEDVVVATPSAVVLLDGAGMGDISGICRHGVAWFTRRLAFELLEGLAPADDRELRGILADAIDRVADAHRGTCDLADPRSPNSTVAVLRRRGDRVDHLVLGDTTIAFDPRSGGTPDVVTDDREVVIGRAVRAAFDAAPPGSREQDLARAVAVARFRETRNQHGGFWVAKDDPAAAAEALIGDRPIEGIAGAGLFSNGVTRLIHPGGVADWNGVFARVSTGALSDVLASVRVAEATGSIDPDDATIAYCTFPAGSR